MTIIKIFIRKVQYPAWPFTCSSWSCCWVVMKCHLCNTYDFILLYWNNVLTSLSSHLSNRFNQRKLPVNILFAMLCFFLLLINMCKSITANPKRNVSLLFKIAFSKIYNDNVGKPDNLHFCPFWPIFYPYLTHIMYFFKKCKITRRHDNSKTK